MCITMNNVVKIGKRLWRYRYFWIFKMVAVRHFRYSKFQILVASRVVCANTHERTNFIKYSQMVVEVWHFSFQNGGSLPSLIFLNLNF